MINIQAVYLPEKKLLCYLDNVFHKQAPHPEMTGAMALVNFDEQARGWGVLGVHRAVGRRTTRQYPAYRC
jgi:hypothetical protein